METLIQTQTNKYSLTDLTRYFLKLSTFGFGGPVVLIGYIHHTPVESTILPAGRTGSRVTIEATYKFSKHSTYFLTLRVASQRDGNAKIPYTRIQNLDRVRIVIK